LIHPLIVTACFAVAPPWSSADQSQRDDRSATPPVAETKSEGPGDSTYTERRLRGRVVWLANALERRHKIQIVPEAKERVLALETPAGQVYTLVEDARGRAFRTDARLREMNVELLVRQLRGTSMIQVVRVYEITDDHRKQIVDYWCDVCSIATFEKGLCGCCQAENRLRKRPAND
jgi:hypothetical protein